MSLAALENALADAMYANAAAGKINTEAYGLNKDEMASVMAATIKTYHLSSAVTDLGYETNAAGVVTAVTFTGSSGMTSAMESMTNSDDEVIAQQADSYAQAYVAENSDTFAASAAADGHTYGEPKWYWNDTNPEDGHTHTWKETPDGYGAFYLLVGIVFFTGIHSGVSPALPARPFTLPACPLTRARLRRNTRNPPPAPTTLPPCPARTMPCPRMQMATLLLPSTGK